MIAPESYEQRRDMSIRHANFHILTCIDKECILLTDKQHNSTNVFKISLAYSYELFLQKENEVWIRPNFQDHLFNKDEQHEATFNKPIPTPLLDQLTDQTEKEAREQNKVGINIKRRNYYFYKYLNLYHKAALKNSELKDLTKQQTIDKLLTKVIDTFMLARVITYYDIIENGTASYPEIVKYFKEKAYPLANT